MIAPVTPEIALEADLELSAAIAALSDDDECTYYLRGWVDQPRVPRGSPAGGQFASSGGLGGGAVIGRSDASSRLTPSSMGDGSPSSRLTDPSPVLGRLVDGHTVDNVTLDDLGVLTGAMADDPSHVFNLNMVKPKDNPDIFTGLGMPRGPDDATGWRGMPQISNEKLPEFFGQLRARGINVHENVTDQPRRFRASQSELDGGKTGGIARAGAYKKGSILATSDGWIIDGHHRFTAAIAAHDMANFTIIDMPIMQALTAAQDYMESIGERAKRFGEK